jgi:hypothetical protein
MPSGCKSLAAVMAAFLLVGSNELSYAQSRETDALVTENIEALTTWIGRLDGRVTDLEARLQIIAEEGAKNPELMEVVGPLAKLISARESGNQKKAFLDQLVELACRNIQDNCELRRRIEELERWRREQEGGDLEPSPTPVEPTPNEPVRPTPGPEYAPLPPVQPWDGTLDYITDRRDSFCPYAMLVARCVNCPFPDGDVYHGDVYLTCQRRYVLLRHAPRYQYRSVLASR